MERSAICEKVFCLNVPGIWMHINVTIGNAPTGRRMFLDMIVATRRATVLVMFAQYRELNCLLSQP